MPYPELLVPPGTQGQKIELRSGKQGPCFEEGPVLGPILGAGSGVSFRIGKSPSMQKFRVKLYEKTHTRRLSVVSIRVKRAPKSVPVNRPPLFISRSLPCLWSMYSPHPTSGPTLVNVSPVAG
jgi:hypothetical protein